MTPQPFRIDIAQEILDDLANRHVSAKVRAFIEWAAELFARTLGAPMARPADTDTRSIADTLSATVREPGV